MMAKLARRELPAELPATPTLPELLAAEPSASLSVLSGRYVVLGEPGAGKSTLCRHLCFALAKDEDGPVPIFASLARLARDGAKSVFDLAEEDAAFHFDAERAAGLSARLRERAEAGGAWLFLDGLDEVSGETARARVRTMIADFAADERIARVAVTSREVGYERLANGSSTRRCGRCRTTGRSSGSSLPVGWTTARPTSGGASPSRRA